MRFIPAKIADIVLIEPNVIKDNRGWFMESFNQRTFTDGLVGLGLPPPSNFVQDNQSSSLKGVLRGLHYQLDPFAQGKLVSVTRGSAFDVVVDIRRNSPTFGQWHGIELNSTNNTMIWIPPGFAHGFLALENDTCVCYKTTTFYSSIYERSILWNDPSIGINWPDLNEFIISDKDRLAPLLDDSELF